MTPKALAQITEALEHIQRAQAELDRACEKLSPIVGMITDWRRVGQLSDRVKAEWYKVAAKRHASTPFRLDSEPQ